MKREDDSWRAEVDGRTLAEYEAIRNDAKRYARAIKFVDSEVKRLDAVRDNFANVRSRSRGDSFGRGGRVNKKR